MKLEELLKKHSTGFVPLIAPEISPEQYISIDLSASNSDLKPLDLSSSRKFYLFLKHFLKNTNKSIAYGGYLEHRNLYKRSPHFDGLSPKNQRHIHLGIDLWHEAQSPVLAAFDGVIHSFKNNSAYGDYGPTIILEHHIHGIKFFTLYGHLSLASIVNLKIGAFVKSGQSIGSLGHSEINGDYPPHLHFQIIKDIEGNFGDYPGVCSRSKLEFYKQNCPDPNLFLKYNFC